MIPFKTPKRLISTHLFQPSFSPITPVCTVGQKWKNSAKNYVRMPKINVVWIFFLAPQSSLGLLHLKIKTNIHQAPINCIFIPVLAHCACVIHPQIDTICLEKFSWFLPEVRNWVRTGHIAMNKRDMLVSKFVSKLIASFLSQTLVHIRQTYFVNPCNIIMYVVHKYMPWSSKPIMNIIEKKK